MDTNYAENQVEYTELHRDFFRKSVNCFLLCMKDA